MWPGDVELRPLLGEARQVPDEGVRRVDRQQLAHIQRLLADEPRRLADAAHLGVAHQRLDGGRPRHTDRDRQRDAMVLQRLGPGCNRLGGEQELRRDEGLEPWSFA